MTAPSTSTPTQYIALPFVSWPLHEGERMVLPRDGRQAQPLHETLAQTLMLCDQWRSLDRHVSTAIEKMPQLQPHAEQLKQGLLHMVEQGLLVDAAKLSQSFAESAPTEHSTPDIQTLYVRTYCCPQALERLLQSLLAGRAGASVKTLVVIDDAREENDLERSRTLLGSYRDQLSAQLVHITRADRERLADAIAVASGASAQDLRWWLNGDPEDPDMTAGATLNTALLLGAGTATAIIDDDAQLTPYGDPQETTDAASVKMGGAQQDEALWHMYPSAEAMGNAWSPLDIDPLADHSRWLGQPLTAIMAQATSPDTFWQPVTSADLHSLNPRAQVKVSVCGVLGDPGTGQASWLYTQPPERLQPWLQSEDNYRQLVTQRLSARKPQGHQLLPNHSLLSLLIGVDNRQLIPPTTPTGRGEDTIFAELVCGVYPDSLFAQLPWMLKHTPEQDRQFSHDRLLTPIAMDANLLLTDYLHKLRHAIPSADASTRLQWLGQSLKALSQAPDKTLAADYQINLSSDRSNMAQRLINNLQTLQPPAYLANDMQTLLTRCMQGVDKDQQELDSILRQARRRASQYSQALNSWQTAWEYCREIGESQTRAMARAQ
ncbi:hypothetical protein [Gilvimarinus sp. 1_MG-2023]|uniref:hypothetical protein n=1 Tax=Gilvimarinus sp. 1_MG-2023 TaxID=3062638 RepID=UPI0026E2F68E|nr:hypothetical protein [Gilvimarinus sp. 1_MG-2023]MDO6746267.1 hypothetical protein [Gilvimarinus sp. 1_MG-2023]